MSASADIRKDVCCEGSPEGKVRGAAPGEAPVRIWRAVAR